MNTCALCGRADEAGVKSDYLRTAYIRRDGSFDKGFFVPKSLGDYDKHMLRQAAGGFGQVNICSNRAACDRRIVAAMLRGKESKV